MVPDTRMDATILHGFAREPNTANILIIKETYTGGDFIPGNTKSQWAADVYTPDLKLVSSGTPEKVEFPNGERANNVSVVSMGSAPKLMYCQYEKKEDKLRVYLAPLGQGGKIGPLKRLGSLEGKIPGDRTAPDITYAADSSHILLMMPIKKSKAGKQISCVVADRNWKVTREDVLTLPGTKEEYLLGAASVHSDASVWIPVWTKGAEKDMPQEIWVWKSGKNGITRIDVSLSPQLLVTSMALSQIGDAVYVGGLYSVGGKKAQNAMFKPPNPMFNDHHPDQGSFLVKVDLKTQAVLSKKSNQFSEPVLAYFEWTEADLQRGDGVRNLVTRKITPLPDGGMWLNLEVLFHVKESQTAPASPSGRTYTYPARDHHGPAVAIRYDNTGKVVQNFTLGKYAYALPDNSLGYFFAAKGNRTIMLYNDYRENLDQSGKKAKDVIDFSLTKKHHVSLAYTGYGDKEIKAIQVLKENKKESLVSPREYLEYSPGTYIFFYESNGEFGLIKIEM